MRFKLLYTYWKANQKVVVIADFKNHQMIEFTLDELDKDELPIEIKTFANEIKQRIHDAHWEYRT